MTKCYCWDCHKWINQETMISDCISKNHTIEKYPDKFNPLNGK